MNRVLLVSAALAVALSFCAGSAGAQDKKSRKAAVDPASRQVKTSLFSGSESQIYAFGYLLPDCTIPIPTIRIVTKPQHGDVRFDETKVVVTADKTALQKQCLGKTVDAVRMFFKANDDYVGTDRIVVDVDSKTGGIARVTFSVEIR